MMHTISKGLWICVLLSVFLFSCVEPLRHDILELMYKDFPGAAGCFRRLNGTHQFGCSSPRGGSFGVIYMVSNSSDLSLLLEKAVAGPYMAVLRPSLFTKNSLDQLMSSDKISGVLVAHYEDPATDLDNYSPDDTCPNVGRTSCDAAEPWNPSGNKFLLSDWPKPIFLISDKTHLDEITKCHNEFNLPVDESQLGKPLCSLHMSSHMFAAGDSNICMRKLNNHLVSTFKYCDPLGNENILLPMINPDESKSKKSIVIASRIDSASMFDGVAPGAMSSASGLISLILAAHILNDLLPDVKSSGVHSGVMFVVFNGEAFDFIGSQRMVFDMERGVFVSNSKKMTLDDISLFIDISQLGPESKFYIHKTKDEFAASVSQKLVKKSKSYHFDLAESTKLDIPPVSLTTFLKAKPDISGLVLGNYDKQFVNRFYNGIFDTASNLKYVEKNLSNDSVQSRLAEVAATVVLSVVGLITNDDQIKYELDMNKYISVADELLKCFVVTRSCDLFSKVYPSLTNVPKLPNLLPLYVGVDHSHIAIATGLVLAYLASPRQNISQENCTSVARQCTSNQDLTCIWFEDKNSTGKGECVVTSMKLKSAISPAFDIDNYDWNSGLYSTWTESVWGESMMRMFIRPSRKQELSVFVVGLIVAITSVFLTSYVSKRSEILFAPNSVPERC